MSLQEKFRHKEFWKTVIGTFLGYAILNFLWSYFLDEKLFMDSLTRSLVTGIFFSFFFTSITFKGPQKPASS